MADPDIDAQLRELLPRLCRFARWLTRDATTADDLVQSTVERALSRWIFAIAYRQFLDGRRRVRRYARMLELFQGHAATEAPSVEREVVAHSVVMALERLPEAQRHLLLWISVEGLSYREVANLLGVPIGTVMSRLSRARVALRLASDGDASRTQTLRSLK